MLNEEWTARPTRTFLDCLTLFGVVQPTGVRTSTCSMYGVVDEKGRLKTVSFREPFAHAVSWKKWEVSRSSVYCRLREPFAETEGWFWRMEAIILIHRLWALRLAFPSRGDLLGGCYRALVSGCLQYNYVYSCPYQAQCGGLRGLVGLEPSEVFRCILVEEQRQSAVCLIRSGGFRRLYLNVFIILHSPATNHVLF